MMVERNYDEDDHSFRERLDSLTDKFREKRQAWSASTRQTGAAGRQKARQAVSRTQDFYSANPLVVGILAAAAGAAMGSALPVSRQEREKLGSLGEKAREMASEQTVQLSSTVREKKDELLDKADRALESVEASEPQQQGQQSSANADSTGGGRDKAARREPPFIGSKSR